MEKIKEYIQKQQNVKTEFLLFNSVPIKIFDALEVKNKFSIDELIKNLELILPLNIKNIIKSINILNDPIFNVKKVNAFYHDNQLFISNKQDDINDIIDDIVHEFAHAINQKYTDFIHEDGQIEKEFLQKRNLLKNMLKYRDYNIDNYNFDMLQYDKELDDFFYKIVKYEIINKITNYGLLISPYAITSLQEYFATGFEEYVLGDHKDLAYISPMLYKKIKKLLEDE